jgi:LmbE family N-acetylglucosaminyl deacetylase
MARRLFLLPHPDDEFAVSVHLRDAVQAGDALRLVYLTDGGFSGQDVRIREDESLRVLARLGVPASSVTFLGRMHALPDGGLHAHLSRARAALATLLGNWGAPDIVYVPAWEGGHQDHDASHLLGLSLASPGVQLRQFPLYQGAGLPGPFFRVMAPLKGNGPSERRVASWRERLQQLRICFCFPSQWKTWLGLTPFVLWHLVSDGGFHLQLVDPGRTSRPPHAGRPLYERRGFLTWREFADATADFREQLPGLRAYD